MNGQRRTHGFYALLFVAWFVGCGGGGGGSTSINSTSGGGSGGGAGGSGSGSAVAAVDGATYHNDIARTRQQLAETTLTPANVNATSFGKIGFHSVDRKRGAEPLYPSNGSV